MMRKLLRYCGEQRRVLQVFVPVNERRLSRALRSCFSLGHMPQAAAFDQTIEIFREVGGVVPCALQSLSHQQNLEAGGVPLRHSLGQVFLKQFVTDAINVFVHLQDLAGTIQVKVGKALMDQIQHLAQSG